jgi:hypothetical protein
MPPKEAPREAVVVTEVFNDPIDGNVEVRLDHNGKYKVIDPEGLKIREGVNISNNVVKGDQRKIVFSQVVEVTGSCVDKEGNTRVRLVDPRGWTTWIDKNGERGLRPLRVLDQVQTQPLVGVLEQGSPEWLDAAMDTMTASVLLGLRSSNGQSLLQALPLDLLRNHVIPDFRESDFDSRTVQQVQSFYSEKGRRENVPDYLRLLIKLPLEYAAFHGDCGDSHALCCVRAGCCTSRRHLRSLQRSHEMPICIARCWVRPGPGK